MDAVFQALAHPHRRRILDLVSERPGMTVAEIAGHFEISRIAVMKHLRQLEAVDLLITERTGREKHHYFNVIPIQRIHERWTDRYSRFLAPRLTDFARRVEAEAARTGGHHDSGEGPEPEGGETEDERPDIRRRTAAKP